MIVNSNSKFNPNPITKLAATILLGISILHMPGDLASFLIVCVFSLFYFLQKFYKNAIGVLIVYSFYLMVPNIVDAKNYPFLIQVFISMLFALKIFYLPFMSGKFFFKTSDITSIITSMDKLRIPQFLSIPISVMFRFFPAYKEERRLIKNAMKIRGINIKDPIKYFECFFVPLITISINTTDDIAKAAETKCIASKTKKTNYKDVKFSIVDLIFIVIISVLLFGGIYGYIR